MTIYNKRLDEALKPIRDFAEDNAHSVTYEFSGNFDKDLREDTEKVELLVANAKQALTSLIKELVAEAKPDDFLPEGHEADACINHDKYTSACCGCQKQRARNYAIDEFEQNLLKALSNNGKAE